MILSHVLIENELKSIRIENGKILSIEEDQSGDFDGHGLTVLPGLIDVHAHGFYGMDTMDADLLSIARELAKKGTTSWLPTTMTSSPEDLKRVTEAPIEGDGCHILGIHLEGPYISKKYKGAQNETFIRPADLSEFLSYPHVRVITVAPETEGCLEFIQQVTKRGYLVVLGHTAATYDQSCAAFRAGANGVTHLYNAMPPFHHRETGVIGAAFLNRPYAQIICDGLHVSRAAVLTAYKMLGADRMILISDSIRPAGLPDGQYESGGLPVTLKGRECRLADGTLAGSVSCLWDCVRKAIEFGISRQDAVRMASQTPAEWLGVKKGKLAVGYDADLLLVDQNLELQQVFLDGKPIQ
jgi:N-acetylglucosamine-6-phosphate deacetylase